MPIRNGTHILGGAEDLCLAWTCNLVVIGPGGSGDGGSEPKRSLWGETEKQSEVARVCRSSMGVLVMHGAPEADNDTSRGFGVGRILAELGNIILACTSYNQGGWPG